MILTRKQFFKDLFVLTKPKISLMTLLLFAAGFFHAQSLDDISYLRTLFAMLGLVLLVSGASSLNMYIEKDKDALMQRTKNRPLACGRLKPFWGIFLGVFLSLLSLLIIFFSSNLPTFFLAIFALVSYAFIYTPLKQKTWFSLIIGSIPGALPVMLGYVSRNGFIDEKSLALFAWAFLWQIPHFLAISIFRQEEYTKAGFEVFPKVFGVFWAKVFVIASSWVLVFCTISLFLANVICVFSFGLSLLLGAWFLYVNHKGFIKEDSYKWAKKTFKASLVYQSLLFLLLLFEPLLGIYA